MRKRRRLQLCSREEPGVEDGQRRSSGSLLGDAMVSCSARHRCDEGKTESGVAIQGRATPSISCVERPCEVADATVRYGISRSGFGPGWHP